MAFRGVLFDWDGTLVHDDPAAVQSPMAAVAALLAEHGHDEAARAFEPAFAGLLPPYVPGAIEITPRIDDLVPRALAELSVDPEPPFVEQCCQHFASATAAAMRVFDDARAILGSLKYRGFRLAVVSNTIFPEPYFRPRVTAAGLAGYFDALICSADVGYGKPHPAPYEAALKALHLDREEALFVGDRLDTDIAGAEAAGVFAVRILRDGEPGAGPPPTIDRLASLTSYLGEGVRT